MKVDPSEQWWHHNPIPILRECVMYAMNAKVGKKEPFVVMHILHPRMLSVEQKTV